jgi:Fe-S-cluster containining protein
MKQLSRRFKEIEEKEKKGAHGSWRRDFCRQYSEVLCRIQSNTFNSLMESLKAKGETITCRRGCTHCCYHYVAVSLAHGIVIADYLYKSKELLKRFVEKHELWRRKGYSISNNIDRARIQALSASMTIDRVLAETRPLSQQYLDMNIQCPFLEDHRCMIYEVRPLSCSGHYAASPPDRCAPGSRQNPVIHHMVPGDEDLMDIMRMVDPQMVLSELTLPTMIHKILTEGSLSVMSEMAQHNNVPL